MMQHDTLLSQNINKTKKIKPQLKYNRKQFNISYYEMNNNMCIKW